MKKLFFVLLACLTLVPLILAGCSSDNTTTTTTTTTTTKTTTTTASSTTTSTTSVTTTTTSSMDYPIPLNPDAEKGGTMIINHNATISFISAPADGPQLYGRTARPVFEPLFLLDTNQKVQPWLATSYTIATDGKAITMTLREGIEFTDGTPFDAEAVKFNFELDLEKNIVGAAVLNNVVSYDIPDAHTITLNLAKPDATLMFAITQTAIGLMASPTAQKAPVTPDTITEVHMVGTGPFMYDSWQRDNYIQFKANPNYWQEGKPYLAGLRFNFVPDLTASLLAFRSGQADLVWTIDPVDADKLKSEGYFVDSPPYLRYFHYLMPDGANPDSPFAKLEVREALEYALHKSELAAVGNGYFDVATQFAIPLDPYYDSTITPRDFNIAKCKELLTEAGYPDGVDVIIVTNQAIRVDTENLILAQLEAGGFHVTKVDTQQSAAFFVTQQKGWKSTTPGVGAILMPGFPAGDSLIGLVAFFTAGLYPDLYQPAGWLDGWNAVTTQVDDAQRNATLKSLVRMAYDHALIIPYQTDGTRYVASSKVQGWKEYFLTNGFSDYYLPSEIWLKTK